MLSAADKRIAEATDVIVKLISSPIYQTRRLIGRPVFVLFGLSGAGKTSAIRSANERLSSNEQIAESFELLWCTDVDEAERIVTTAESEYEGCRNIAFTTVRRHIAQVLAERGTFPVIFVE